MNITIVSGHTCQATMSDEKVLLHFLCHSCATSSLIALAIAISYLFGECGGEAKSEVICNVKRR